MALAEPIKKGGRYTKKEQEERRLKIFQLHFEEGKPAARIAELVKVNRNTVNKDVEFWYKQFSTIPEALDINSKMKNQIERMEIQRERVFGYLEEADTIDEKIRLEKLIYDINNKLAQFFSKAIFVSRDDLPLLMKLDEDIEEDRIKEFVSWVIKSEKLKSDSIYSEDQIKNFLIWYTREDQRYANSTFQQMMDFGLGFCKAQQNYAQNINLTNKEKYDLERFAIMRGYFTKEEIEEIVRKNNMKNDKAGPPKN